MIRVCFVCLGNICRSPTAEGIMAKLIRDAGLAGRIEVDSAGTGGWHTGEPADPRARKTAEARGVTLTSRARRFAPADFQRFDHVIAMDRENLGDLEEIAPDDAARRKLALLRGFEPATGRKRGQDVPDPYYGGPHGFDDVFDICEAACRGLLAHLREVHGL